MKIKVFLGAEVGLSVRIQRRNSGYPFTANSAGHLQCEACKIEQSLQTVFNDVDDDL